MFRKWLSRLALTLVLALTMSTLVSAQGGALQFDTLTSGTHTGSPIIYTFTGNQDTIVTVYAIGGNGLQPTLALSNSSGQPLAFNIQDALTPMSNDVRVTAKLPATDTYIVTLNSQAASTGTYSILLTAGATVTSTPLTAPTTVTIAPQSPTQQFSVAANPAGQTLNIQSTVASNAFTAQIQTADGQIIAAIAGLTDSISLSLPASTVGYIITIGAENPVIGTVVTLSLGTGTSTTSDTSSNTTTPQQPADPNACTLTSNNANLRGGPGTNYEVVGALVGSDQFVVTGQNNGWFYGIFNGRQSWVAASVVNQSGNCGNLAFVDAPPAPVVPQPQTTEETSNNSSSPTATATTQTNNNNNNPTPTTAATATLTPTTTPFVVNSFTCLYVFNDGATVRWDVTGAPNATFQVDVRQNNTVYSATRSLNASGFSIGNQRFGQVGNSNYTAYLVYNGQDLASDDC